MKNGGKNKSVAFIILFSVVKGNREKNFFLNVYQSQQISDFSSDQWRRLQTRNIMNLERLRNIREETSIC